MCSRGHQAIKRAISKIRISVPIPMYMASLYSFDEALSSCVFPVSRRIDRGVP
jgi:hypothetical protein